MDFNARRHALAVSSRAAASACPDANSQVRSQAVAGNCYSSKSRLLIEGQEGKYDFGRDEERARRHARACDRRRRIHTLHGGRDDRDGLGGSAPPRDNRNGLGGARAYADGRASARRGPEGVRPPDGSDRVRRPRRRHHGRGECARTGARLRPQPPRPTCR